ncbi:DnaJ domain-containing protein [Toxoplasma gondii RUB]|uniref:DnaJ domain-containing protein n=11 Tax=Toxoplasma gondii TaxID=5811 RepID=S7V3F5_TOXGG|nr:DnaJ domain-containing protein [Toxoplasma gondii GT1]KAF4642028.1 DnaJ domain-containing protein [Toxoplasma gondii]KFG49089.1 DnaJ domain-containing protein [Toxoplasma gondii GAB2-2007-GAL-DOM2]KFG50060.1 DnaJ domain-containing protein [Toxoplasma gondii FOU]KFG51629.1 DnaJ domain-containing protein [Toxoplasma gondii p89]KFG64003.1 DnaJ domain-containing protein [Toxoplasma gondii RUB]KFH11589.1 DnaJ domain-containing protein [Toxoplasma gondii VAND]KFH17098.1 DnaJ domain-containing p
MSNEKSNHYVTLGVSRTAPASTIRSAYLRLAKQYHPDLNVSASSTEKFKRIQEAYAVLRDAEKRADYDATLPRSVGGEGGYASGRRHGFRGAEWRGEREFDQHFREQVERIQRERDQALKDMENQRTRSGFTSSFGGFRAPRTQAPGGGMPPPGFSPLPHALLRTLPLLLLPCLLVYGVYRHAKFRRDNYAASPSPSPILYDDLGRAFMTDSKGRQYRVMEFDVRGTRPGGS